MQWDGCIQKIEAVGAKSDFFVNPGGRPRAVDK